MFQDELEPPRAPRWTMWATLTSVAVFCLGACASGRDATSTAATPETTLPAESPAPQLGKSPLPEVVAGKRIVVVDDSIVRGNTTRQIVQMLRDAGASEVHMRISAPPIKHPCHYGIDMSTREEMIAHNRTEAEVAAELGADSLAYLSLEGVYEAIRSEREAHCDACFSGEYPLVGTSAKDAFEHALPVI